MSAFGCVGWHRLPKQPDRSVPAPSWGDALRFWLKLGFISFGGPAGQIAIMHRELVEDKRWISEARFLHALNYCMLLPGPEAQQLATYLGWLMHRTLGGILAGLLFVLPSLLILIGLSWVYVVYGQLPAVAGLLYGIKPAVAALVLQAAGDQIPLEGRRQQPKPLSQYPRWSHRLQTRHVPEGQRPPFVPAMHPSANGITRIRQAQVLGTVILLTSPPNRPNGS